MLARALEGQGVATTTISMVREHTEQVKPPRALFVPFPFGFALGRPNDPALQHRVLAATLELFAAPAGPVLRDFPDEAEPGDASPAPVQASAIAPVVDVPDDAVAETKDTRGWHERWMAANGGRTAFGLAGLPAERFDDVVRFLERFAAGENVDMPERPADLPVPDFIRYCADDLKALHVEAHLAATPDATGDAIARWFWSRTATAQVLRRVRDRLDTSDDPRSKAAAFGVAR